jgi:hypothetical protein
MKRDHPATLRVRTMFVVFSNRLGCLGSIAVSVVRTALLILIFRGC